jgi:hypothetical protein
MRSLQIGNRQLRLGEELEPFLLSDEEINRLLDCRDLAEVSERASLYRLLHHFSKCPESERVEGQGNYEL